MTKIMQSLIAFVVLSSAHAASANVSPIMPALTMERQESEKTRKLREFSAIINPEAANVRLAHPTVREAPAEQHDLVKVVGQGDPRLSAFTWELHIKPEALAGKNALQMRYYARYTICKIEWARFEATYGRQPPNSDRYYLDQCTFVKYPRDQRYDYVTMHRQIRARELEHLGLTKSSDAYLLDLLLKLYRME